MYSVTVHPSRKLVVVRLGGMMSVEETNAYMAELRQKMRDHGIEGGYLMQVDVSACPIQSQAMIDTMRTQMATLPKARRIAMIVGGSLARMQVRRLMTQPYVEIFETPAQAAQWLLSDPQRIAELREAASPTPSAGRAPVAG